MTKKENHNLLIRIGAVCLLLFTVFFILLQTELAQIIGRIILNTLTTHSDYEENGVVYYDTSIDRGSFKLFLVGVVLLSIISVAGISYLIARNRINKVTKVLTQKIPTFLTEDTLSTTGDVTLDNELLKIKALNVKNEELLKRETQRTKDLITYLAHDLKTPLASVIGYLNLLIDSPELTQKQRGKFMNITLDKAGRLEELINEFFDITRFSLQEIHLDKIKMDVVLLTQQMIEEFYPLLKDKRQELRYEGPETLLLEADSDQLARVLNNLLKNALAYGNPDSTIFIRLEDRQEKAVITIENEGPTIPKRQLEMIFDKFYRLDHARSTKSGGAGLGLAIAKEIILAHDGEIKAISESGVTRFEVDLPNP